MPYIEPIRVGQGYQLLVIDVTGSDSDLLAQLQSAKAKIVLFDPEELIAEYSASLPIAAEPPAPSADPVLYHETRNSILGEPYTATVFRFGHQFAGRGQHLVAISLTDSDDNETWALRPIVITVGNGLPEGF